MTSPDIPDTGAGTPLTAEEKTTLSAEACGCQLGHHGSIAGMAAAHPERSFRLDAARSRPATDPAGLDATDRRYGQIVLFDVDGVLSDGRVWRRATARPGVETTLDTLVCLGFQLVAWSSGGAEYARRVCEALTLHGPIWRYAAKPAYPMTEETALAAVGSRPVLQIDDDPTERIADWPFMEWPTFTGPHRAVARLSVADGPGPEERLQRLRAALTDIGFAQRHLLGDSDVPREDAYAALDEAKRSLRAALPVHREELGHGTPVPEEAELPSGDARIEGLGHGEEPSR